MIAQEFALAYPKRVDKLILSNSFPKLDGSERQMLGVWKHMAEKGHIALFFEEFTARMFTPEYMEAHSREVATFKLAITAYPPPAHSLIRQIEAIERHDTHERLGQIQLSTLVLSATDDRMVPTAYSEELTAKIPNATLEVLPRSGHAAFIEESELYNAAVLRFLTGVES